VDWPLSKADSFLLVEFEPLLRIGSDFRIVALHDGSLRRLTFDMSGDRRTAKLAVGRPSMEGLGVTFGDGLQVFWTKARVLCDADKHTRTEFLAVMEGEHEVDPAFARQRAMGA
jgi:hypothetical protein